MEEHAGVHLAEVVYSVILEYKIEKILGYFVMDHAFDNDTMMILRNDSHSKLGINFVAHTQISIGQCVTM